jgi:hypothetical protein
MDQLFLQIVGRDRLVGDLAQRNNRVLVAVAIDGERRPGRDEPRAMAREQHELEAVFDLVDAILDGDASHGRLLLGCRTEWEAASLHRSPLPNKRFA